MARQASSLNQSSWGKEARAFHTLTRRDPSPNAQAVPLRLAAKYTIPCSDNTSLDRGIIAAVGAREETTVAPADLELYNGRCSRPLSEHNPPGRDLRKEKTIDG